MTLTIRLRAALLGDKNHWVRRLPGRLLHNVISHGIARIAEFLTSDAPQVIAHGFVSPFLKQMNENEIVDELRVIISEEGRRTAYFTFSSQMRPSIHQFGSTVRRTALFLTKTTKSCSSCAAVSSRATPTFLFPLHCLRSSI